VEGVPFHRGSSFPMTKTILHFQLSGFLKLLAHVDKINCLDLLVHRKNTIINFDATSQITDLKKNSVKIFTEYQLYGLIIAQIIWSAI